jgi:phosphoribosylglycinamide formyltransferase 1
MDTETIALLTIDTDIGRMAACCLARRFPDLTIIVENRVSRLVLLRGRVRRLGFVQAFGQLAFMAFGRVLTLLSHRRIATLIRHFELDASWPDGVARKSVSSVNAPECIDKLKALAPRAVLVVGTRIISAKVLAAIDAPFINYHAGITPKYRGIHGGYWAKAEDDLANFGVTVHLVDPGIDTGPILYQARQTPEPQDNYATFPYLQLAAGLPLLAKAGQDALAGTLAPKKADMPSQIWSHPTLWEYVFNVLRRGAW